MRHNRTLKEAAAARMRAGGEPLLDLAREYGVSTNTLRTWLRESETRLRAQDSARRVATALTHERYSATSQRQRLLMHALEQSPATIIVTDVEGKILYANPKFVETTGYSLEEAIGQNPRLLKSGETSTGEYQSLWKTITRGKEWRGTFHNRRKDGSLYWERASISPVFDAAGRIANFMAVKEDITGFMEADAARRQMEDRYEAVIAGLPCGIVLLDGTGCVLIANAAAVALLGLEGDAAKLAGLPFDALNLRWQDETGMPLSPAEHPVRREWIAEGGKISEEICLGAVPPLGGVRWLKVGAYRIDLPGDGPSLLLTLRGSG